MNSKANVSSLDLPKDFFEVVDRDFGTRVECTVLKDGNIQLVQHLAQDKPGLVLLSVDQIKAILERTVSGPVTAASK